MEEMEICGSCYQLVEGPKDGRCPRCRGPLHPNPEERLSRFALGGTDLRKRGTTLADAQDAASSVLGELLVAKMRLHLHHLDGRCAECDPNPDSTYKEE